jgi:hypothetical protein
LEDFFYDGTKKGIQPKHAGKLGEIPDRLNQARETRDMNFPGSRLHLLLPVFGIGFSWASLQCSPLCPFNHDNLGLGQSIRAGFNPPIHSPLPN